jgi:hypothetical protein
MAEADISAVGLAVQIAQLHHDSVSAEEIQSSLQNLCRAQGIDELAAQARVQEASHIWSAMSTVLQRPEPSTTSTPQTTRNHVPVEGETNDLTPSVPRPTNTVVNKQVSGAQKPRLDLLVAYLSLVVTYISLAVTSSG